MGHDHHGHAGLGQLLHDFQHLTHHFRVQGGGRLVKKHDLRLHHQRPDDGHPLLLAAGKLDGIGIGPVLQAHPLEKAQGLFRGLCFGHSLDLHGGQDHVVQNGLVGEQVEMLEYHAHFLPQGVDVHFFLLAVLTNVIFLGDVHDFEENFALAGGLQQVQAPQEGGFAGAGGSDDDHHVAGVDVHADAVQGMEGTVIIVLFQVLDLNQITGCRHDASSFQSEQ